MSYSNECVSIVSQSLVAADSKSSPIGTLRLTIPDLQMLTFKYIQKGCLFSGDPPKSLTSDLKYSLSKALSVFPPLAGHLSTDPSTGNISVTCSNTGALFVHARASSLRLSDVFDPASSGGDVPEVFKQFFSLNDKINLDGHSNPLAAVQVTELADSFFIACSVNHAVADGTSFWNFFNTLAEICREAGPSPPPSFSRGVGDNVFSTDVHFPLPAGRLTGGEPIRERIFHFSTRSVLAIKERANNGYTKISSFQSLCAHLWRSVTRARNLAPCKTTTFSMVANCRSRVSPEMDPRYFGNAIQIISTVALAGEVVTRELGWSANLLHRSVMGHGDRTVRKAVEDWEREPHALSRGNKDGAGIRVASSPRFPIYENDFGWGPPVAVRSGKANKSDGIFYAFPGREGDGSVDMEVLLKPQTMSALQNDPEFLYYVNFT